MNESTNNRKNLTLSNYDVNNNRQIDINKRLFDVNNDINNEIYKIENYCQNLENYKDSPYVTGDWWRLGGTSVKEINDALDKTHSFVYRSFGFIGEMIKSQNANTKNICEIIILLAAAEAKLYNHLKELTTVDQEDIEKLRKLEEQFLKSLENHEEDKETVREQFERLIDYTQAVENVKNKWIRGLEVKINDVYKNIDRDIEKAKTELETTINIDRQKHEDSINAIKKEVDEQINILNEIKEGVNRQRLELQKTIDSLPNKMRELCDERFNAMHKTLSTNQESFHTSLIQTINGNFKLQDDKLAMQNDKLARQDVEINKLKLKSFFDSKVYKIGIGIIAMAALVCSLFL